MKNQWNRLVIAAIASSSVFALTFYWYHSTGKTQNSHSNEKPLAYVGKVVDDIQRRQATRLLWQLVNTGEPLYDGEAIRTSDRGEVRIQFTDSDRYLDLEPESLIVIKKTQGEIALDLMEGSLFVNAKAGAQEGDAPGLVLNSANGKVDLSQASASLSKGSGNSVDVQVLEGKASVKSKDGKSTELSTGSMGAVGASGVEFDKQKVKVSKPNLQKPVAMNADDLQPIPFEWSGFPTESQVSLYIGKNRRDMKPIATANMGDSSLMAELPFGKHYWKLVAKSPLGETMGESAVYRMEVIARYAPTVVFPTADVEIPATTSPFDMTFKWQKSSDTRQMTLQVWDDPKLSHSIATKSFTTEDSYTLPGLKDGTYYWRMTSYFNDSEKPVLGKMQKFSVKYTDMQKMAALPAATPPPAPKPEVKPVAFTMAETQMTQYFVTSPKADFSWGTENLQNVSSYRVRLHDEAQDASEVTPVEVKENKFSAPVPKPGRYIASIEAMDKDGQVVGTGSSKAVTVAPMPILQAPLFIPTEGPLQASMDGRSTLEWNNVEGATDYELVIKKEGKELKRSKYKTTTTAIRNLLPGEYDVTISARDTYGRPGETGPVRKLIVPDKSNLKAPTLKKIKVN
ncbi:hypothetical protein B9G69_003805 [Bdellovibrio sp. SKB1291214]|uniref:FecR domain-containing protein n=1 Tax=Bdellovibrio sp. SKB1291214 TaxID=1732569 RepID=UPI000B51BED9|nr:hypothetical protein [Bdellovibrio sp. SKB1291214]UYL09698.1 hypothetical protein B9G69_003805 [Bdellovibrio sp. SKB1291214]